MSSRRTDVLESGPAVERLPPIIAADVLGDAVLWFSILPNEPRNLITLPAVLDVRDGGNVLLANGWVIRRAPSLARDTEACDTDTVSLSDFIERFADRSTSTYNMDQQRVTTVTCLEEPAEEQ